MNGLYGATERRGALVPLTTDTPLWRHSTRLVALLGPQTQKPGSVFIPSISTASKQMLFWVRPQVAARGSHRWLVRGRSPCSATSGSGKGCRGNRKDPGLLIRESWVRIPPGPPDLRYEIGPARGRFCLGPSAFANHLLGPNSLTYRCLEARTSPSLSVKNCLHKMSLWLTPNSERLPRGTRAGAGTGQDRGARPSPAGPQPHRTEAGGGETVPRDAAGALPGVGQDAPPGLPDRHHPQHQTDDAPALETNPRATAHLLRQGGGRLSSLSPNEGN